MFTIKKITTQRELDQVVRLDRMLFANEDMPDFLNSVWWIALDGNNTPVGYTSLVLKKTYVSVARQGVLKRAQGRGLQKKMLAISERYAKSKGYKRAVSSVAFWNGPSLATFIRSGYRITNLNPYGYPSFHHALSKKLTK